MSRAQRGAFARMSRPATVSARLTSQIVDRNTSVAPYSCRSTLHIRACLLCAGSSQSCKSWLIRVSRDKIERRELAARARGPPSCGATRVKSWSTWTVIEEIIVVYLVAASERCRECRVRYVS